MRAYIEAEMKNAYLKGWLDCQRSNNNGDDVGISQVDEMWEKYIAEHNEMYSSIKRRVK